MLPIYIAAVVFKDDLSKLMTCVVDGGDVVFEWMNEWMNEWLIEWMDEWMNEWMNEWNEMKWNEMKWNE